MIFPGLQHSAREDRRDRESSGGLLYWPDIFRYRCRAGAKSISLRVSERLEPAIERLGDVPRGCRRGRQHD